MTPEERHFKLYLEDIHLSMTRILEYVDGKDFAKFKQSYMVVDAVVRNFEIIGEASKNIPDFSRLLWMMPLVRIMKFV